MGNTVPDFGPQSPRSWDPDHYLSYGDLRLRPALDLLARVPLQTAATVTDLGCGPGNVTPYLRGRFVGAEIQGIDRSPEMLDAARATHGNSVRWHQADAAQWHANAPQDLIYANAALHWLDDHETLFPRLMASVAPGGVLAVQMPNQFAEPSHTIMRDVAAQGPWTETLRALLRPAPVARPETYYDWLIPSCKGVDIWQTQYMQVLHGDDAVLDWISSTALKPLLEALDEGGRTPFLGALAEKLRRAYPMRADGTTLFPFKRLFIVARKSGDPS